MDISRASQLNINDGLSGDLRVNFDILFHVMHELHSRPHLLSLMKTCKTLYHNGIPLLLKIPIDFAAFLDSNQLRFLESLQIYLERHSSRLQFIEEVMLPNSWGLDPKTYHRGVHVFKILYVGCHNLKKLEYEAIETYRDDKRYSRGRLLPVGHTFHHLQSLTITRLGPDTCQMLKSLKAPLVYLSLCYDYDFSAFRAPHDPYPKDPVPLLVNFPTTLEELTFYWCQWDDRWDQERNIPLSPIRCPKVHTLKINNDSCPDTATLMYVFPNLKHLQVQNESGGVTFHEDNLESQAALAAKYHWRNLETVSADINSLYSLALLIKVHQLDTDCGPTTFLHLHQVLKETKPTLLKLRIGDPNPIFDSDMDKAREMLHYEDLSRLWLKITLFGIVRGYKVILTNEMVSEAIDGTIELLRGISLQYLCLSIEWIPPAPIDKSQKAPVENPEEDEGNDQLDLSVLERTSSHGSLGSHAYEGPEAHSEPNLTVWFSPPDPIRDYLEAIHDSITERLLHAVSSVDYLSTDLCPYRHSCDGPYDCVNSLKVTVDTTTGDTTTTKRSENIERRQFEALFYDFEGPRAHLH